VIPASPVPCRPACLLGRWRVVSDWGLRVAVLNVHRFGTVDGSPLLALHGIFADGRRFRPLAEEGVPEFCWLAVDLRGHGGSTWDPPWNAERHVADLLETLDAEGIERCDVVGHSFGGLLATLLAASAPDRVRAMVLLDPAIGQNPAFMREVAEEMQDDDGWASEAEARADALESHPPGARRFINPDLDGLLQQLPSGRWRLRYSRPAMVTALGEMARPAVSLTEFPGRTLLIPALQYELVGPQQIERLQDDLGTRLTVRGVDGGHDVYWDAFDELVGVLRDWFALGR
jgi:lipase